MQRQFFFNHFEFVCMLTDRAQQSSTAIAHANVLKLFDSQLKMQPDIGFPTLNQSSMNTPSSSEGSSKSLKRKSLPIDGAPSLKHQKVTTKDDDEESIEFIESNRSFNNVEQNRIDLESGASMEKDHCSLDKVISLYEKFAFSEFRLSEHQDREVTLEEYLEVINVKRITKTRHLPILRLSSDDKFQVLTGYQKTTMNFECKGVNGLVRKSISYMSCQDRCLVWNGSAVRHIKKWDYRTVAAKDFFCLVRDPAMTNRTLEFDVKNYHTLDSAVWPLENEGLIEVNNYSLRKLKPSPGSH